MKRSTYLCVHCKQYSYRVQCFWLFTHCDLSSHLERFLLVDPPSRVYDSMCDAAIFCYGKGPVTTQMVRSLSLQFKPLFLFFFPPLILPLYHFYFLCVKNFTFFIFLSSTCSTNILLVLSDDLLMTL